MGIISNTHNFLIIYMFSICNLKHIYSTISNILSSDTLLLSHNFTELISKNTVDIITTFIIFY